MQPTRLLKYYGELRETDSILKDELFLPFSRLINLHDHNTNDKSKGGNLLKMTDTLDQETMIISTENIRGSTDLKISMKCETVKTNSTGNVSHSRRAKFTKLCSININNDRNKSDGLRRENFLNSKYFDLSFLRVAEQRMSRHLKTVLKTDEFEKENQPLNPFCSGSKKENLRLNPPLRRSQKENLQLKPCFNQPEKENKRPSLPSGGSQKGDMRPNLCSFDRSQNENQQLNPSCLNQPQKENKRLNVSSLDGSPKDNLRSKSSFNVLQKKNQNVGEASRLRETSIPTVYCKQMLLRHPNNITPLDPQVELLIGRINRHPSIYVTETGFINILLRQGILLEVTVDKAFRLVDLNQNMAATVSGRTKACSVNHSLGVICQSTSSADFALGNIWQAKIRTGHITVGDRCQVAWFDKVGNFGTSEYSKCHFVDTDLIDYTVDLLLFSALYGPMYVPICKKLVSSAKFESTNIGSVTVHVNDVKIIQRSHGDVIVMSGSKLLKMRPRTQSVEIYAGSTKIDVSSEWGVTCHMKNSISLICSNQQLIMSNGSIETRLKGKGQINLRKVSDKTH